MVNREQFVVLEGNSDNRAYIECLTVDLEVTQNIVLGLERS